MAGCAYRHSSVAGGLRRQRRSAAAVNQKAEQVRSYEAHRVRDTLGGASCAMAALWPKTQIRCSPRVPGTFTE